MNGIQNYQISFQAGNKQKAARTLADIFKNRKEVKNMTANFSKKYHLSKQDTIDLFEIDKKTTPKDIRAKSKTIFKNLDELWEEVKNMECVCKNSGEDKNIHEGIIDIIN